MSDTTSQTATKRAEAHYTAPPTIHRVEADGTNVVSGTHRTPR
jgi:hypothetical protein